MLIALFLLAVMVSFSLAAMVVCAHNLKEKEDKVKDSPPDQAWQAAPVDCIIV